MDVVSQDFISPKFCENPLVSIENMVMWVSNYTSLLKIILQYLRTILLLFQLMLSLKFQWVDRAIM